MVPGSWTFSGGTPDFKHPLGGLGVLTERARHRPLPATRDFLVVVLRILSIEGVEVRGRAAPDECADDVRNQELDRREMRNDAFTVQAPQTPGVSQSGSARPSVARSTISCPYVRTSATFIPYVSFPPRGCLGQPCGRIAVHAEPGDLAIAGQDTPRRCAIPPAARPEPEHG
jgi:hypothetical protein